MLSFFEDEQSAFDHGVECELPTEKVLRASVRHDTLAARLRTHHTQEPIAACGGYSNTRLRTSTSVFPSISLLMLSDVAHEIV